MNFRVLMVAGSLLLVGSAPALADDGFVYRTSPAFETRDQAYDRQQADRYDWQQQHPLSINENGPPSRFGDPEIEEPARRGSINSRSRSRDFLINE